MAVAGTRGDSDSLGNIWGMPLPGVTVSLSGGQEILLGTPALFRGYFPDETGGDTFATGDLGRWKEDGQLQVLGRKDFVINTGGEKVNPEEVEAALVECFPQCSLAVSSRPDARWGEQVVAVFETDLSVETVSGLQELMVDRLAPYKVPKLVLTGKVIPRTAMGKVNRAQLKSMILEE